MRKLASIQEIKKIEPIEGADAIEKATILGWELVVKKGEFKKDDLCVYFEVDSFLPIRDEFEFLRKGCYKQLPSGEEGFRLKTIRLRGQISQGLALPTSILGNVNFSIDDDVTERLGITKYEPPIPACLGGTAKGNFPSFLIKTDETRVQVLQHLLDKYVGKVFYSSEKLDGSSSTMYIKDDEFGVCSRNLDLKNPEQFIEKEVMCDDGIVRKTQENSFWKVAKELQIEEKMRSLGGNYAIQGELIGEGIQNNKLKIKGQTIRIFNVFDIDKFKYLSFYELKDVVSKLELEMVPIIDDNFIMINDIQKLVEYSKRKSMINPDIWIEGVVFRVPK